MQKASLFRDPDYDGLSDSSTDDERLNVVFKILLKSHTPIWLSYHKLFIKQDQRKLFNAKLKRTGLVEYNEQAGALDPDFKLNDSGYLLFEKYSSYLEFLKSKQMSEIDLMNKVLSQLNTKNVGECHDLAELEKATNLDKISLDVICKKIHAAKDCNYHPQCTTITNEGKFKANRGGYKEEKALSFIKELHIGDKVTTHGSDSPAFGKQGTQNNNPPTEIKKEKWYNKILNEFSKHAINYIIAAVIGYAGGLLNGKACNQHNSQQETKRDTTKNAQVPK